MTFLSAASIMLAACSSSETGIMPEPENGNRKALCFAVDGNKSKAVATNESLRQFSVWANYRATGAGQQVPWTPVFTDNSGSPIAQATVVKDQATGAWSYGDVQYWYPGNSYSFQAFHAATDDAATAVTPRFNSTANNGAHYLSIEDFNGTEGTDLLYAVDVCDYIDASSPSVVNMNFSHLTAKIIITGTIDPVLPEGHTVTITSARLYGMESRGSWSGLTFNPANGSTGQWTVDTQSTRSTPYAFHNTELTLNKTDRATDIFIRPDGSVADIMMLPQEIPTDSRLEITYYHNNETSNPHTVSLNIWAVSTQLAGGWKAGTTYRYSMTFGGSDYIIFDMPQVEPWTDEGGGNIIIQKPS